MKNPNNLKAVRKGAELTLEQLSERSGYSVSMLSRWESGQRRLNQENLKRLSDALKRPASEIVPQLLDSAMDEKINRLGPEARKELNDFADYLIQKHSGGNNEH